MDSVGLAPAAPDVTTAPEARTTKVRGVVQLTSEQLRFQRRVTLIMTIAPLAAVIVAMWQLWGTGITPVDFWLFLGFYTFTGLGISVGYHRLFTHRSFQASPPVRIGLAIAGSMAIEGDPISWSATHRRHHAYADRDGDPHSPHLAQAAGLKGVVLGLWHAHVGWLFDEEKTDPNEWTSDLIADPGVKKVSDKFVWLVVASFVLPAILGGLITWSLTGALTAFLWASLVRIFLLHHVTWSINSICHFFGKEAYRAKDESKNVWALSPISFGESWHNNHHAFPWSARLGLRAWQFDPGWYLIVALRSVGLISKVKVPTREQRDARRITSTVTSTRADAAEAPPGE
jgi:stearoyl-CoA desaturase (delta-9 desaturase)